MDAQERAERFEALAAAYAQWHAELRAEGDAQARPTARGMWVSSTAAEVFELLERLGAEGCRHFADLGSGDGLVTCIASLFCPATGIECDATLVAKGREMAEQFELPARFVCADYLSCDLSAYDLLYAYPDKPLFALEEVLMKEILASRFAGRLVVYGPHFPLERLARLASMRLASCQATVYGPR